MDEKIESGAEAGREEQSHAQAEEVTAERTESGSDVPPPTPSRPPGRAGRGWVWLILLLLFGGGLLFLHSGHERAQTATGARPAPSPAAVAVETATARQGSIGVYVNALGTVTPLSTVTVKTRVDGQLMRVNYREGEMVREGDLLAEIDPRPFQAQLTQAEGQYERDKAILENARVDLERYRLAYSKNAIPKQQLDTQEATVRQYEGIVKNDQGVIDGVKLQLAYCRLTSPTSGRVGLRQVDPGNVVQTTDTNGMLVITQMQPITVVFSVAEDYLPRIRQQLRPGRRLSVEAFDRTQQKKIAAGYLLSLDNQIDTTTGTLKLRAVFANKDNALFPNQFVNVRLLISTQSGATLVPTAAIQRNAQGAFVYVLKQDQTVAAQTVTVGTTDGEVAAVEGVQPGATAVVDGFDKLQTGVKVAAHKVPKGDNGGGTTGNGRGER